MSHVVLIVGRPNGFVDYHYYGQYRGRFVGRNGDERKKLSKGCVDRARVPNFVTSEACESAAKLSELK